jgi:hypothetical protein
MKQKFSTTSIKIPTRADQLRELATRARELRLSLGHGCYDADLSRYAEQLEQRAARLESPS